MKLRLCALLLTAISIPTAHIFCSERYQGVYDLALNCDTEGLKKLAGTKNEAMWKILGNDQGSAATTALISVAYKASNFYSEEEVDDQKRNQEQYTQMFYTLRPFYPNVNYADNAGITLLHRLTEKIDRPSASCIRHLLNAYPNINLTAQDSKGNTPLHYCARQTKHHRYVWPVAHLIIDRVHQKHKLYLTNANGHTALNLAVQSNHRTLADKLKTILEEEKQNEKKNE